MSTSRRHSSGNPRWLLDATREGDQAAEHELLRRYEPLVRRVAWELRPPPHMSRDDLAQEARIGLLAAIRAWRPERGPFPAFADRCASNQALLAVKAACRHKHQLLSHALPLDGPGPLRNSAPDRPALRLIDTLPAPDEAQTDPESCALVREELTSVLRALPTLTDEERTALGGMLTGYSSKRLALLLGRTPKAASQAAYRARRKLAAALPRAV